MDAQRTGAHGLAELAAESIQEKKPVEMEARIARLESDVAHVSTHIADIKADLRTRFDRLESKLDKLNDGISTAKISGLLLYIALAGTLLGVMASGFGWI
jgi:hypothetical protein